MRWHRGVGLASRTAWTEGWLLLSSLGSEETSLSLGNRLPSTSSSRTAVCWLTFAWERINLGALKFPSMFC